MLELTPVMRKFIMHWGEMGTKWGVNRTVAQIHALLFVSPRPLDAEEIAQALSVARSNVSTSLRELSGWGIIRVVHSMGERRDRFESMADVWEMFRVVLDERKKREVDPTLKVLAECVAEAAAGPSKDPHAHERLGRLLEFFQTTSAWYEQMRRLPTPALPRFLKLGDKVLKLVGLR
jgi:DNA-binding transcriptional regulator GbsR (MarR family)